MASAAPEKEKTAGGLRNVGRRAGEVFLLDPDKIIVEQGFNVRDFALPENKKHVEELAASIAEVGVQQPLTVRLVKGEAYLVNGESRLRATIIAREKTGADIKVPVIQEITKLSEADRVAALITMNDGKALTPLEQSQVFSRLKKHGLSDAEIAKKVGRSTAQVNALLKLYEAPENIKTLVSTGKVAAFNAVEVIRQCDGDYKEAHQRMSDAVAEAAMQGKERASAKTLTGRTSSKNGKAEKSSSTPLYYQRSQVNSLIFMLVEIAADTKLSRSLRDKVKDTLADADVDWKEWAKELKEQPAE